MNLPAPEAPPRQLGSRKLDEEDAYPLAREAAKAAAGEQWARARHLQYWAVQRWQGDGAYVLATYEARLGDHEAAFYWLQRSGLEDWVNPEDAEEEEAFENLHSDQRWESLLRYLRSATRYVAAHPLRDDKYRVPDGYRRGDSTRLVIWLHGSGARADDFTGWMDWLATNAGCASVSVSGTAPAGPRRGFWREDADADLARVSEALNELADRVQVAPEQTVLLGFMQGGQVALELAARHPDRFAGAIAVSPGYLMQTETLTGPSSPLLAKRRFVVAAGASEPEKTLTAARGDATKLTELGAKLQLQLIPEQVEPSLPEDPQRLVNWVDYVLGGRAVVPATRPRRR